MWARQRTIKMILGVCLMNYEIDNNTFASTSDRAIDSRVDVLGSVIRVPTMVSLPFPIFIYL